MAENWRTLEEFQVGVVTRSRRGAWLRGAAPLISLYDRAPEAYGGDGRAWTVGAGFLAGRVRTERGAKRKYLGKRIRIQVLDG